MTPMSEFIDPVHSGEDSHVVATDDGRLEEKQESDSSFYKGYILQNKNLKILLTLIIK